MVRFVQLSEQPPLVHAVFENDPKKVRELILNKENVNYQDCEGRSPLHAAAFVGNAEIADILLLSGARVDKKDSRWLTPLHRACRQCSFETVEILLQHKASIVEKDRNWQTALHVCSANNAKRCAEFILPLTKDLNIGDRHGRTPLMHAAMNGKLEMVELLLQYGVDANARDKYERRAIHYAAFNGHLQVIKQLVAAGADPSAIDKQFYTALHCASASGQLKICKYLTVELGKDVGVDVNSMTKNGDRPLHIAANNGKDQIVQFLIDCNALLNVQNLSLLSPLHFAAASTDGTTCLEILLQNGANVNARSSDGRTPLHLAAIYGRFSRAKTLIHAGADVDVVDVFGNTPLHLAASRGQDFAMKQLIQSGANVNKRGPNGLTPLLMTAFQGYMDPLRLLLKNGSDCSCVDEYGRNAFHLAAFSHSTSAECVELLHLSGVQLDLLDKCRRTPLHFACIACKPEVVEKLLSYKCDPNVKDAEGRTPVHYAAYYDQDGKCVQLLLSFQGQPMMFDKFDLSPLHYSTFNMNFSSTELLLESIDDHVTNGFNSLLPHGCMTPLHIAAAVGDQKLLTFFLKRFPPNFKMDCDKRISTVAPKEKSNTKRLNCIDARDKCGLNSLHWATVNARNDCLAALANSNADFSLGDGSLNMTPLHLAAAYGHVSTLKAIVSLASITANVSFDVQDVYGRTPLMLAVSSCNAECALFLLSKGCSAAIADKNGRTALHRACVLKDAKVAESIMFQLTLNGQQNCFLQQDNNGRSALHYCALSNNETVMITLLTEIKNSKLSLNQTIDSSCLYDNHRFSPLHLACYYANESCVEVLLDDPLTNTFDGNKFSPLHFAAMCENELKCDLLIERFGKQIVNNLDHRGRSPLHIACFVGRLECVQVLVKNDASVNHLDMTSRSPLMYACVDSRSDIVEVLLKSGADLGAKDRNKNTALHLACLKQNDAIGCLLLNTDGGVDAILNCQNKEGKTALHIAARNGLVLTVEKLLLRGASISITDDNDHTPALCCAIDQNVADCLALILCAMFPDAPPNRYSSAGLAERRSLNIQNFAESIKKSSHNQYNICSADLTGQTTLKTQTCSSSGQSSDSEFF